MPIGLPPPACRVQFRRRLLAWYRRHARDLPWRRTKDPYHVWLSEIMLQQTQVGTVKAYFQRFVERFPTIAALAEANEEEVLRLWEGLGYYRRARQLHQAAKVIRAEHAGRFPSDRDAVRRLPGIGRYTAGAILSIAFDAREPILEANTTRLFTRLLGYRGDPASAEGTRLLWSAAEAVLPRSNVGAFNQALMELGSQVCIARPPQCDQCPAALLCRARALGIQHEIPRPRAKRALEARHEAAVIVRRRGRVLLVRRPDHGRWAGLWDFPRFAVDGLEPDRLPEAIAEQIQQQTGACIRVGRRLTTIRHGVTRFRITLDCYEAECVSGASRPADPSALRWLKPSELEGYPLSTTGRQLGRLAGEGK